MDSEAQENNAVVIEVEGVGVVRNNMVDVPDWNFAYVYDLSKVDAPATTHVKCRGCGASCRVETPDVKIYGCPHCDVERCERCFRRLAHLDHKQRLEPCDKIISRYLPNGIKETVVCGGQFLTSKELYRRLRVLHDIK